MFFSQTTSLLVAHSLVPRSPVSSSQLILPLPASAHVPFHASCPLAGSLEPFCLTTKSKQNMEGKTVIHLTRRQRGKLE